MTDEYTDIAEKLTQLRNDGYNNEYVDGFSEGYISHTTKDNLNGFLTNLRGSGVSCDCIEGYEDGYNFMLM